MALDEPTGMIQEKMLVVYPAGTHLSEATGGGNSALARADGTNELRAHATLHPLFEEDEPEATLQPVVYYLPDAAAASALEEEPIEVRDALILIGVIVAAEALAPHARRLWNERALPAIRSAWEKRRAPKTAAAAGEPATTLEPDVFVDSSQEFGAALEAYRGNISSAEARERFAVALAARLFSDEQLRLLSEARIVDEIAFLQPGSEVTTLTPKQVGDRIASMLEADPSLLDDGALFEIGQIVGSGPVEDEDILAKTDAVQANPV